MLRADVAVGGGELRVAEVVADEHRVRGAGKDAAGRMAETVKLDAPEAGDLAGEVSLWRIWRVKVVRGRVAPRRRFLSSRHRNPRFL
jgi:hypothetical protein